MRHAQMQGQHTSQTSLCEENITMQKLSTLFVVRKVCRWSERGSQVEIYEATQILILIHVQTHDKQVTMSRLSSRTNLPGTMLQDSGLTKRHPSFSRYNKSSLSFVVMRFRYGKQIRMHTKKLQRGKGQAVRVQSDAYVEGHSTSTGRTELGQDTKA